MASMAITSSLHIASCTHHVIKKQQPQSGTARSLGSKQVANVVTLDVEGQKGYNTAEHHVKSASYNEKSNNAKDEMEHGSDTDSRHCGPKFVDERWKNGTWDLNMFVHDGKMDRDGVIVAEARRRKFIELHPEAATNQDPVLFRTTIIPWWAWLVSLNSYKMKILAIILKTSLHYYLSLVSSCRSSCNGRILHGILSQTGNFICKAGLFVTVVISVILLRRTEDFENLKKLADEATFYDKQWQASWQDQNTSTGTMEQTGKKT
ncbi:hypothetical protein ACB098_12G104000 [Castanea mollissima]